MRPEITEAEIVSAYRATQSMPMRDDFTYIHRGQRHCCPIAAILLCFGSDDILDDVDVTRMHPYLVGFIDGFDSNGEPRRAKYVGNDEYERGIVDGSAAFITVCRAIAWPSKVGDMVDQDNQDFLDKHGYPRSDEE